MDDVILASSDLLGTWQTTLNPTAFEKMRPLRGALPSPKTWEMIRDRRAFFTRREKVFIWVSPEKSETTKKEKVASDDENFAARRTIGDREAVAAIHSGE